MRMHAPLSVSDRVGYIPPVWVLIEFAHAARYGRRYRVSRELTDGFSINIKSPSRYDVLQASGRCGYCGDPLDDPAFKVCSVCRDRVRVRRQVLAAARPAFCSTCRQRPPVPNGRQCAPCREKVRKKRKHGGSARERSVYRQRREAGTCTHCGLPALGKTRCPACRENQARLEKARRAARKVG